MIDVVQQSLFELVQETRQLLDDFEGLAKRTVEVAIKIGHNLIRLRDELPHGEFLPTLQSEFGLGQATAYNFIHLAEAENKFTLNVSLPLYIRTALASPTMPQTVIEQVESGQIPATIPAIREAKQEVQAANTGNGISELYSRSQGSPTFYTIPVEDKEAEVPYVRTPNTYEGGAIMAHPVQIDRESHHVDPLEEVREKRDAHVMRVMGSSDSPEWYTPQEIVRLSIELLGEIDLDPCSNSHETPNVPACRLYTKEDNGLAQTWQGKVYLNPPYGSEIPQWIVKLVESYRQGVDEAIALLPARIDTIWFQPLYEFPMCNVRGRIQYENSPYSAPFPCVIVYLGERIGEFIRVFGNKGPIMRRIG